MQFRPANNLAVRKSLMLTKGRKEDGPLHSIIPGMYFVIFPTGECKRQDPF